MRISHILVVHSVDPSKLFHSIPNQPDSSWLVFFHGTDPALLGKLHTLMEGREGQVYDCQENRGLARSWNDGIHQAFEQGQDVALLLNDDLFFYEGAYESFTATFEPIFSSRPDVSGISPNGMESGGSPLAGQVINQGFACIALPRATIEAVGYFDEAFWPAYYEDLDYARRYALSGRALHGDDRVLVEHERSLTTRLNPELRESHDRNFNINRIYYERKWGGTDDVFYSHPFNDSRYNFYLSYEDRQQFASGSLQLPDAAGPH